MRHGSLFSGIGGFELAAEWMGWENKFHCEWNEFGQKVLHHYWPESEQFTDITKSNFTKYNGTIDIISGGFPCQPYSAAGKRMGKNDERHLWPEMLRAITEIQPRWVVGENVFGIINWSGGLVFNEVQTDLETEGYEVFPFVLPACGVNAPHRRDRVWFVAFKNSVSDGFFQRESKQEGTKIREFGNSCTGSENRFHLSKGDVANTECNRKDIGQISQEKSIRQEFINKSKIPNATNTYYNRLQERKFDGKSWDQFPTQSPICGGDDGISTKLDGITFPKWRNESIKAYGNAVCPQVVLQIFKAIEQYDKENRCKP